LTTLSKQRDLDEKSMLVLKQQLDGSRESEERLAAQLREMKEAMAAAVEPSEDEASALAVQPNGLFQSPPEQRDDLQQIRGIGEGFGRVSTNSAYILSQLAGLSAPEIVWVENRLPTFRGRVGRRWPGQAAARWQRWSRANGRCGRPELPPVPTDRRPRSDQLAVVGSRLRGAAQTFDATVDSEPLMVLGRGVTGVAKYLDIARARNDSSTVCGGRWSMASCAQSRTSG
jgi:predicted flap endonuclease-1-like 5' DNA nuclease